MLNREGKHEPNMVTHFLKAITATGFVCQTSFWQNDLVLLTE